MSSGVVPNSAYQETQSPFFDPSSDAGALVPALTKTSAFWVLPWISVASARRTGGESVEGVAGRLFEGGTDQAHRVDERSGVEDVDRPALRRRRHAEPMPGITVDQPETVPAAATTAARQMPFRPPRTPERGEPIEPRPRGMSRDVARRAPFH